jgi:hypothetical protein
MKLTAEAKQYAKVTPGDNYENYINKLHELTYAHYMQCCVELGPEGKKYADNFRKFIDNFPKGKKDQ